MVGEVGLRPEDFWDLSISEIEIKSEGFFITRDRSWEHTRLLSFYLRAMTSEGKMTFKKWVREMPLPWIDGNYKEPGEIENILTVDDLNEFEKKWMGGVSEERQNKILQKLSQKQDQE